MNVARSYCYIKLGLHMNLFLSTRKLTDSREDHLTEFLAAAIDSSIEIRERYFNLIIKEFAARRQWAGCSVSSVQTQHLFADTNCCPDMVLTMTNGKVIVCEHKLDAPQTLGSELDERPQLSRYLDLKGVDGLVYVRASYSPPEDFVIADQKYIRPANREHYLWRDLYPIFENTSVPIAVWIREGFEHLGFTPPHPHVGELQTDADRRNFAKLWERTIDTASKFGWDSEAADVVQLYLTPVRGLKLAERVFIGPNQAGFKLRIDPALGKKEACFTAMAAAVESFAKDMDHGATFARRASGKIPVYDLYASTAHVLGKRQLSADDAQRALEAFVSHFLKAIES